MKSRGAVIAGLVGAALGIGNRAARAQDPVRLPEVVTRAEPGARAMAGIVRDTEQFALEGVEVSIPKEQRKTFSRADGSFRFDSLRKGTYQVRARKIGYAPQVRDVTIDSLGGIGDFELLPMARALPAVVSSAGRLGLSGIVDDTSFTSLAGAEVRVMGHDLRTETDSVGSFYLPVRAGNYMVTITKPQFKSRVVSVTIPTDSGRRIAVALQPSAATSHRGESTILPDLAERMAWVTQLNTHLYTHERMEKMGIEWGYDAVVGGYVHNGGKGLPDGDCFAIVDGGPQTAKLNSLTIDEVDAIEVYTTGYEQTRPVRVQGAHVGKAGVADSRPTLGLAGPIATRQAEVGNRGKNHCPTVFVWTR